MKVKDLMTKNVISVDKNDTLGAAIAKMLSARVHQLAVTDGKNYEGMLDIKAVIKKDVDPAEMKVERLVSHVPTLLTDDDAKKAMIILLQAGVRAVPVMQAGEVVGVVSETDFMKIAEELLDKNRLVGEISTPCVYVSKDEDASKVRTLMIEGNISRVPVVEGENVIGVVGTLDLLKLFEGKQRLDSGGRLQEKGVKEKMKAMEILAESIMSRPAVIRNDQNILDAAKLLQRNEEVIVRNGDFSIVTPKDVLELCVPPPSKGVLVQIIGIEGESIEFSSKLDQTATEFVQKMGRMTRGIEFLFIHVERHHATAEAKRVKYSIRCRFKTPFGLFVSRAWGWRPLDVIQEAFRNLEREVIKKKGRLQRRGRPRG